MADRLPTRTLTFVFTDVEGSTRLLTELGAQTFAQVLEEHRAILRAALLTHGGTEVDTQGDAFFLAFPGAPAAVTFAAEVQEALGSTQIRVRIGVHTGEAVVAGEGYVGLDVHRAARIAAAGHGGQVLLSPTTAALLESGEIVLRDLGDHRLKDLSAPVRLYQLGDRPYPPLKTLYRTNLPVPATAFVGRAQELSELEEIATSESSRLLTLVGPGGTGKTRLALQLAAELGDSFPDGISWVPLAPVRDPRLVASTVAQILGVDEEADRALTETVAASLGPKTLLLLLDNVEHLLDAVARLVSPIVAHCPTVLVLATSREPLDVIGERVYTVEPLRRQDAVMLFSARATAAGATLSTSEETRRATEALCERLDDLPLAVELAAARAVAIPPAALLERLSGRLDLLRGPRDADERQQTLRATIDWSYELLDPEEQQVFRRIAVFAGGAALDAVEQVCETDVDVVASLVSKSLVRSIDTPEGVRYWMLETVREFATDLLGSSGEKEAVQGRHLDWFVGLAELAAPQLRGGGGRVWFARLEADRENLRAAFARGAGTVTGADTRSLSAVALTLAALHDLHGRHAEAEEVLRIAREQEHQPLRAAALTSRLAGIVLWRGGGDESASLHAQAEQLLGDGPEDDATWRSAWIDVKLAQAHHHYWVADQSALSNVATMLRPLVEAHGDARQRADVLHVLMQNAMRRERYVLSAETEEIARAAYSAGIELGELDCEFQLGFPLLWRGKVSEAEHHLRLGLDEARRTGDVIQETRCLVYGAVARRKRNDVEGARALLIQLAQLESADVYQGLFAANQAWLAWRDGDLDGVDRHGERAISDWSRAGRTGPTIFQWTARFPMLCALVRRGDLDAAREHARVMLDESQQPLPADLTALLAVAVAGEDVNAWTSAFEAGRDRGYS